MVDYKKQGKRNKAMGADFERRTRKDLEAGNWKVSKYGNNVRDSKPRDGLAHAFHIKKCIPAKPGMYRMMQTGFPDFIAYQIVDGRSECADTLVTQDGSIQIDADASVFFIECKVNGYLSKEEKEKAQWYLDNGYCSKFLIAYKTKEKNRVKVNYKEFT